MSSRLGQGGTRIAWWSTILLLSVVVRAFADPIGCQRGIARASARYLQGRARALERCEVEKLKGLRRASTECASDPQAAAAIYNLGIKLIVALNLSCGGPDQRCGNTDDDPLEAIGWGATCPDVDTAGCTNPI